MGVRKSPFEKQNCTDPSDLNDLGVSLLGLSGEAPIKGKDLQVDSRFLLDLELITREIILSEHGRLC